MEGKLYGILAAFLFIVIGVALLVSLANNENAVSGSFTVTNESVALINGTMVNLKNGVVSSVTRVGNSTVTVAAANYTLTSPQGLTLLNGQTRTYDVTYVYDNTPDATSSTILDLVILFFALGIIGGVLYYLSPNFRDLIDGYR